MYSGAHCNIAWTQISLNLVRPQHLCQVSNRFENFYKARKWYNSALFKIPKRFDKWTTNYRRVRFREIRVLRDFRELISGGISNIPTVPGSYNCHITLQWRHNEHDGVSNHQSHNCLLNCLFSHRLKKTPKFRVTGLCAGNSLVTGPVTRKMLPFDDVIMIDCDITIHDCCCQQ